jgi:type III pantothenate kinase
MKPSLVVDVGNARIKWGWCSEGAVVRSASLPADDSAAWQQQLDSWGAMGPLRWAISSVHPARSRRLVGWVRQRGDAVVLLDDWRLLPLEIPLQHPEWVGMDRLLDAVAARERLKDTAGQVRGPAVIVDAGSAVTVDWLDESAAFRGGAIFPGLRLMVQSLHDHTALLPLIDIRTSSPLLPGPSTPAAMEAGVFWAAAGGIRTLTEQLAARSKSPPARFLTGGDAPLLHPALGPEFTLWPDMTLQGICIAAGVLP